MDRRFPYHRRGQLGFHRRGRFPHGSAGVLGTGAYFDLGSEATGWAPARQRYPGQPLVVLRCAIEAGQVLDLDDPEVRSRFRQFQRQLVQQLGRPGALRLGQGGHVDRFIALLEAGCIGSLPGILTRYIPRRLISEGPCKSPTC